MKSSLKANEPICSRGAVTRQWPVRHTLKVASGMAGERAPPRFVFICMPRRDKRSRRGEVNWHSLQRGAALLWPVTPNQSSHQQSEMEQLKPIRVTAHRWHVAANRQQASISTGHREEKRNTHGHEAEVISDQFGQRARSQPRKRTSGRQ